MVTNWLERILATEAPSFDVIAFNVGLIQTEGGYEAYLMGSKSYDPTDDDWACNEDFTPGERYCAIPSASPDEAWETIRDRIAQELREFLSKTEVQQSFLGKARAVTIGFDDGELLRIV